MENKRVRSAVREAIYLRNYQRARGRALTRLSKLYAEDYKQFLEEEKRRDELEGKKWVSLADSPTHRLRNAEADGAGTTATEKVGHPSTYQSNDEGEA
jgi:hypothetical protein